jgi:serine/threonine-protein kinase
MGVVYKASQRSLGRVVALKVIRDEIACLPEYRERFLREARLAASVDHPHLVPVYDVGETDGKLFLAMQWIEGADLKRMLETSGCLSAESAVAIVTQVASALDAVHSAAGLVHRDVKPANVLVRQVGGRDHAYLTDFGVAKPSETSDQLTKTGWLLGTTGYLSPEQIMGQEPGPRSDLYALGCLLFETLTGQPPFRAENEMAVRWAHAHDPRPKASEILPALGSRYDDFFAFALAIDPSYRFGTGQEFSRALFTAHDHRTYVAMNTRGAIPTHLPTAIGPPTPLPAPSATPPPGPPPYPGYGYATPPPAHPRKRSGSPLALIVLAIVALTGLTVGALAATGVLSRKVTPITQTIAAAKATPAPSPHPTTAPPGPRTTGRAPSRAHRTTTTPSSRAPTSTPTTPGAPPVSPAPAPAPSTAPGNSSAQTGRDSAGYNIGPGCSDDPASSLPGCPDSPSIPAGDLPRSCPNGLTVDLQTTTCGLAESVYANYISDGPVTGYNRRGRTYEFICQTGGPGTTGFTICLSQAGSRQLYVRWHR